MNSYNSGSCASSSTSPNEFVLVMMDEKKNNRELTVGQFNAFGAQSGTLDKNSRPFDYEKIAPGVYKVTPRVGLTDGEFSPKIFDFGIKLPH